MKPFFSLIILFVLLSGYITAQENDTIHNIVKKNKPVRDPFGSVYLIDNQTTYVPIEKTLEFVIQHKFGTVNNGITDLFGIYAPGSNIRMAFNYVPIKNIQIGYGLTKNNMQSDLNIKWSIVKQTRKNTMPVAVTVYANMGIDGRSDDVFGINYEQTHRLSYFSQAIISRKFTDWLSLQVSGSYTHYNIVDTLSQHSTLAVHFNGRVRFSPQGSFIFNYDMPVEVEALNGVDRDIARKPKPNLVLGVEIATSTHAFQIYIGTAGGLLPQEVIANNNNDFTKGEMAFGFTITRLWNF